MLIMTKLDFDGNHNLHFTGSGIDKFLNDVDIDET